MMIIYTVPGRRLTALNLGTCARKNQAPPQTSAAETHPREFRLRQTRVEVGRLQEDSGEASIVHGAQGYLFLHAHFRGKNGQQQGKHTASTKRQDHVVFESARSRQTDTHRRLRHRVCINFRTAPVF